jgi:hypothetical protein
VESSWFLADLLTGDESLLTCLGTLPSDGEGWGEGRFMGRSLILANLFAGEASRRSVRGPVQGATCRRRPADGSGRGDTSQAGTGSRKPFKLSGASARSGTVCPS